MDCKRIALVAGLAVALFSAALVGTAAADAPTCSAVAYNGDGSTTNPYEVGNVDQLQCMGENHSSAAGQTDALGSHYVLTSDIDATGTTSWNSGDGFDPIGPDQNTAFNGTLDGDGHAVTGLYMDRGPDSGIFGFIDNGTVRDLGIEDVSINSNSDSATLASWVNRTEVYDTYVTGNVTMSSCCAGGLVNIANVNSGATEGNIFKNVHTDVHIEVPDCCAGGLIAVFEGGKITNSYVEGDVNSANSCCLGGLVGDASQNSSSVDIMISDSYVTGDITAEGCCNGGFVYTISGNTTVRSSYATGDVNSDRCCNGGFAEGIFGNSVVTGSNATGDVNGRNCCQGGFAAFVGGNTVINDSYATGNVTDNSSCCTGGFVGQIFGNAVADNTYATGDVSADGCCTGGYTGGVFDNVVVKNSFSTGNVEGRNCCIGGFFGDGFAFASETGAVVRSTSTGNVKELGAGDAGGFAGFSDNIDITESFSTGNAESNESNVSGFVGFVTGGAVINKSYARGDATGNDTVGGFVGVLNDGTVEESYSVGVPTATNQSATEVGGFIARDETTGATSIATNERVSEVRGVGKDVPVPENAPSDAPVFRETHPTQNEELTETTGTEDSVTVQDTTDSYWDEEASGTSVSDGGTSLTTSEMTGSNAPTNMFGFDFTNTWETVRNDYPILQNSPDLSILEDEEERECTPRRSLSRGEEDEECPQDREISRGETRSDLDRRYGRDRSDTARRDRGRDSMRRNRGR